MPRKRRLHLPHAGFHITARTQDGAKHFVREMRSDIVQDIEEAASSFGHTLLAQVVMPNHFHIVLRQSETPIGWLMQRVMQRTVMRVRRRHGGEGHVFGRPYWNCVCASAAYLRRAIVYTHMNPCKAGLCEHPSEYAWSSHNKFVAVATQRKGPESAIPEGLMLFADESIELNDVVHNYKRFVDYCIVRRALAIPGDWLLPEGPQRAMLPSAAHGDAHWAAKYSMFVEPQSFTRVNVDVTTHATSLLNRIAPDLDLEAVRSVSRSRSMAKVRRQLIEGLSIVGCRGTAIARALRVSPSLVSQIVSAMRFPAACKN